MNHDEIITWICEGDPALRWQAFRDLMDSENGDIENVRRTVAIDGWGKQLLDLQAADGTWGNGLYSPKWISTTYTMIVLRRLGLEPLHPSTTETCRILIDKGFRPDGGITYSKASPLDQRGHDDLNGSPGDVFEHRSRNLVALFAE